MLKDYQMQLLGFLEQLEMEISNLYKLFAEQFPGHQDLWAEMSREELQHAENVRTLKPFALSGHVTFDEKMTKTYTIRSIIDDIRVNIKRQRTINTPSSTLYRSASVWSNPSSNTNL
jgi:hypothetical protein